MSGIELPDKEKIMFATENGSFRFKTGIILLAQMLDLLHSLHAGKFCILLSSAELFKNRPFHRILSGIPSESQTVWTQIRPDILSGLIWVQVVCKGYKQTKLAGRLKAKTD